MVTPEVLNRHHFRRRKFPPRSLYVGRPGRIAEALFAEHPELGDLTALGNPYTHQRHGARALGLYREWLWRQLRRGEGRVVQALASIPEAAHLVCSCVRKDGSGPCHAKVLVKAWIWWRRHREGLEAATASGGGHR